MNIFNYRFRILTTKALSYVCVALFVVVLLPNPHWTCYAQNFASPAAASVPYKSPYGIQLPYPDEELIPDILHGERGKKHLESKIPHHLWYQHAHPWIGPWGPLPRTYPPPPLAANKSDDWKQARIIATGLRFLGYKYRHHYIPDWDPPFGWHMPIPGNPPHEGKGVDCSNFTSFIYNQGLGIGISSDVHKQAATETAILHGAGDNFPVRIIPRQNSLAEWCTVLKPGDLLFIRPRSNIGISHVVMWIGDWGRPVGTPLILDSHGADVRDANGEMIPAGIYLRPFRANSWYCTNADHAIRIIGP